MTRNPILTMNDESENQLKNIVRSFRSQVQIESFGGNIREFLSKGGKSVRIYFFFFFWIVRRKNWSTVSSYYCSPFFSVYVGWWGVEIDFVRSILFFFFFFFKFLLGIYKSERIDRKIYGRNARNTRELSLLLLLRFRFEQSQVWSREKRYIFI